MTRILVVEDDLVLARGIAFALHNEGWQVVQASSLAEGLAALSGQIDLLLLDVMLPDGSGFDFCAQVHRTMALPVIFLTACDEEVNVVQGLDLGGDDYITKPFRVRELISRIKAVLRRRAVNQESFPLISGEILLDPARMLAAKGGEKLFLSPMEYKLLLTLMENPFQVLSREQILDRLWDVEGEFVDDNTLSVYIRRLREKVEDEPSAPRLIVTVRGFGYKWNQGRGRDARPNL